MWPFKPKKPRVVENVGPDAPKILIAAEITSYALHDGELHMIFLVEDIVHTVPVPKSVPKHYPLGTSIRLVVEKQ
jgi:hypothetical protein